MKFIGLVFALGLLLMVLGHAIPFIGSLISLLGIALCAFSAALACLKLVKVNSRT